MTFAFDDWLRAGLRAGLRPADVWTMTLVDLRALTGGDGVVMSADALDSLCKLYTDGDDRERL